MESTTHTSSDGLPYLLFRPSEPPGDGGAPAIVFLHGTDEHGDSERTLDRVTKHCLPHLAKNDDLPKLDGAPFPFLVACPQTSEGNWHADAAKIPGVTKELVESDAADPERLYVTGISAGGSGAWRAAASAPVFAALAAVSSGVPRDLAGEVDAAAFVTVGTEDEWITDLEKVEADLYAHRQRDERTRFEPEPGAGHNERFWNDLYGRAELYEWLLGFELSS